MRMAFYGEMMHLRHLWGKQWRMVLIGLIVGVCRSRSSVTSTFQPGQTVWGLLAFIQTPVLMSFFHSGLTP
jgi:hypothetical protein